jgi:hypothetical protein
MYAWVEHDGIAIFVPQLLLDPKFVYELFKVAISRLSFVYQSRL